MGPGAPLGRPASDRHDGREAVAEAARVRERLAGRIVRTGEHLGERVVEEKLRRHIHAVLHAAEERRRCPEEADVHDGGVGPGVAVEEEGLEGLARGARDAARSRRRLRPVPARRRRLALVVAVRRGAAPRGSPRVGVVAAHLCDIWVDNFYGESVLMLALVII